MENDVLIERIENIKCLIESHHIENKDAHEKMMLKQDYTNGKVRSLQMWKASIVGAITIIVAIGGYVMTDYLQGKDKVVKLEIELAKIIK